MSFFKRLRGIIRSITPTFAKNWINSLTQRYHPHWCRVVMDRETEKWIEALNPKSLKALEISGVKWKDKGFRSYRSARFPDYDVCGEPLGVGCWDLIIIEQVLEHVLSPSRAVRNMYEMLAPGGVLLVTTPFLLRIHYYPLDCSRWSELGMKSFLGEAGFQDIQTGSWGNRACLIANLEDWAPYKRWHSLANDERYPLVVWALARKPQGRAAKAAS